MPLLVKTEEECEWTVEYPMTRTVPGCGILGPKEMVRYTYKIVGSNTTRRVVVTRDDDTLTPEQVQQHWREVDQAMLAELMTWAKLKCFSCKPRAGARNVVDTCWVIKFKQEQATQDANASVGTVAATTKTIKARLTVRGFKDHDRNNIDTYVGTSTRYSHKLLCSEAVRQGWDIATTDISKAFLQGVTYEELSQLTGEPVRGGTST